MSYFVKERELHSSILKTILFLSGTEIKSDFPGTRLSERTMSLLKYIPRRSFESFIIDCLILRGDSFSLISRTISTADFGSNVK